MGVLYIFCLFMQFVRSKSVVFFNNKWGVGKTTLAYNTAVKFANAGYKTVLLDLDAQCNLSNLAMGKAFEENLFSWNNQNIYGVLKGIIQWGQDIDLSIPFQNLQENLYLLPWSLKISGYQDLLITAYNQASAGQEIWYFQTSAISRYLQEKGMEEEIDIFVIDVSPSLDLFNRIILLSTDYFITPLMPDAFSVQWVANLWDTLEKWKHDWKVWWKARAKWIASEKVLSGEWLFIWYIVNSYNQYAKQPIQSHRNWIAEIPNLVKEYLSEKHCKNWLVEQSWKQALMHIKDFWELPADAQFSHKAIFDLVPGKDFSSVQWTLENYVLAQEQFDDLSKNILKILETY